MPPNVGAEVPTPAANPEGGSDLPRDHTEQRDGRPTPAKVKRLSVSDGNLDTASIAPGTDAAPEVERPRCRRCRHVVWAPESVATGLGRVCRRRARAALVEAVAA